MGALTGISWTKRTQNFWRGCTKKEGNPACANCYAEAEADERYGIVQWGPEGVGTRVMQSTWGQPTKWNEEAEREQKRHAVFAMSWGDFLEDWNDDILSGRKASDGWPIWVTKKNQFQPLEPGKPVPSEMVRKIRMQDMRESALHDVIDHTPWLLWYILTKRPENAERFMAARRGKGGAGAVTHGQLRYRDNVMIGYSAGDQRSLMASIRALGDIKGKLCVSVFLSLEPLTGEVDLTATVELGDGSRVPILSFVDWVIVGGESKQKLGGQWRCRKFEMTQAMRVVEQCGQFGVPVHVKQMGDRPMLRGVAQAFSAKKGSEPDEWPEILRRRDHPELLNAAPITAAS